MNSRDVPTRLDHVVVDVEVMHTIEETPGEWDATDKLGVGVACVWEYLTGRMRVYGPEDVSALQQRLLDADRITGYNSWNFDLPVIWGMDRALWNRPFQLTDPNSVPFRLNKRSNDLLRRIWTAQGFNPDGRFQPGMGGSGLGAICGGTLGVGKIGEGKLAPVWLKTGQVQKVVNYCADDVALTRDLSDFVDRYGYVIHRGRQLYLKR